MAELQGPNRTSCPPQGGASSARLQAGIPPGNGAPQGADPGAGPAAPGAKLGGSAQGPTAADGSGGAGIPMTVRAELRGPNRTSCPPQGGASSARLQAGIPPGNGAPQGADPGAGPAAPGAKLGGSAQGPTAADGSGGAGIPMTVRAELRGPNRTSCPPQGGASSARLQAGIPPGNGAPQGADPGAGPAAPGAKLGGSAQGPTAADGSGGAGIPMTVRAELRGPNRTSCPPQGGASSARLQAGIPPGNGAPQGADPGAGPAAPGAKLGGSAQGPTAADGSGGAGIPMTVRAELRGPNRTSCPPQGGASSARLQAGIPPGNGAPQGADPGAGPAAPGAKLGGSAQGPTAADGSGGAGIPMTVRAELRGPNGTSCPPQGGADPGAGPAAVPGAGPGSTSYQEGKCSARPRPTPAGAAQRAQAHRRPSRWWLCGCRGAPGRWQRDSRNLGCLRLWQWQRTGSRQPHSSG
ncbi:basic salivary proline-rich protein 3-like [Accipiter gentilis]|uniref:basic salivary proline-rich protein 3-like n=1 Tax=Astur gentilis TaxID=8957 RepID=UPI00210FC5AE|nr:basic salivary proline-rich protein 3-like [Accipiter gentilis]